MNVKVRPYKATTLGCL